MKIRSRWIIWAVALALPVGLVAQERVADRQADAPTPTNSKAWKPDTDDREDFREIVELNIFQPDRAALAGQQDRNRNPPPVIETNSTPAPEPEPIVPTDPDRSLVLVGMSIRGGTCYAFIENRTTGQTDRVAVPGEYAKGALSAGDVDGLTYTLDDGGEQRQLRLGQTFTGEVAARGTSIADRPATPGTQAPGTTTPGSPAAGPATPGAAPAPPTGGADSEGLSELERRLRERRLRGE